MALTPLLGAIVPFIVWPLELVLPYPAIVEELGKAAALFLGQQKEVSSRPIITSIQFGTLFALSESTLYLFNIIMVGTLELFILRLLLIIPLHVVTSTMIAVTIRHQKKRWALVGIAGAMLIHYGFNLVVGTHLTVTN